MPLSDSASPLMPDVHKRDPDRFATVMLAPALVRKDLLALLAFNAEIARTRVMVRESLAGQVRLQWWRDLLDRQRDQDIGPNPVAAPLIQAIMRHALPPEPFDAILTARQSDLDPIPFKTEGEMCAYAAGTSGALAQLQCLILGADDHDSLKASYHVGTAWALCGLLRALPVHLAEGWQALPGCNLAVDVPGRIAAAKQVTTMARDILAQARVLRPSRQSLPVLALARLTDGYLNSLQYQGFDPFSSQFLRHRPMPVRLAWAMVSGRF